MNFDIEYTSIYIVEYTTVEDHCKFGQPLPLALMVHFKLDFFISNEYI